MGAQSASLRRLTVTSTTTSCEETIMLAGRDLAVLRPRDSEALLDEQAFEHEEFLPYWAELWPSGVALAKRRRRPRAARRAHAGARLRAGAAEHGGGAGRRARAGHRLVARRGRARARERGAATTSSSRCCAARGTSPSRCSSARPGTWCSAPTCSTSAATRERLLRLLPRLGAARGDLDRRPRPPAGARLLRAGARALRGRGAPRAGSRTAPSTGSARKAERQAGGTAVATRSARVATPPVRRRR